MKIEKKSRPQSLNRPRVPDIFGTVPKAKPPQPQQKDLLE